MSPDRQSSLYNEAPVSVFDLRRYEAQLFPDRNANNYRVNPTRYGSVRAKDLGLCQETFLEDKACRYGMECPWRHQSLTEEERAWIAKLEGGPQFPARSDAKYAIPCKPVISSFSAMVGAQAHSLGY
jgi:hypothetical protein